MVWTNRAAFAKASALAAVTVCAGYDGGSSKLCMTPRLATGEYQLAVLGSRS